MFFVRDDFQDPAVPASSGAATEEHCSGVGNSDLCLGNFRPSNSAGVVLQHCNTCNPRMTLCYVSCSCQISKQLGSQERSRTIDWERTPLLLQHQGFFSDIVRQEPPLPPPAEPPFNLLEERVYCYTCSNMPLSSQPQCRMVFTW